MVKKYWVYFRSMLSNSLEYRGALITWTLVEIVILSSSLFLWAGIFRDQARIGGYQLHSMITYYFLLPVVGAFTTVFISENLPREIKDGVISTQIIKPYNFAAFRILNSLAVKLTQLSLKFPVYISVGILLWPTLVRSVQLSFLPITLFVCLFAYVLNFFLDYCLSLLAFWVEDTWSFSLLKQITTLIFGGLSFPLNLVPDQFLPIFNFLPFKYIYYVPVTILQGQLNHSAIFSNLIYMIIWIICLWLTSRILWTHGLKKYGAYGQ